MDYRPVRELSSGGALEFHISGNSSKYIDLKNTRLKIKFTILQGDGNPLPTSTVAKSIDRVKASVALKNRFLQSMWRQVDLSLQQVISPHVSTKYGYRAYMETLLVYGMNAKESQLQSQMYYKDVMSDRMSKDPLDGGNMGLNTRARTTAGSSIVDLKGPVYNDMCLQSRYILNGMQVGLKLWPSSTQFRLMSANPKADYRVEILDAALNVCVVEVAPEVVIAQVDTLQYGPARYFYQRTDMKSYALAKGQFSCLVDNVFQGDVPECLVVGLVSSEAFMGSYSKNPYEFQTYMCNFLGFYVDGKSVPMEPLTPDYKTGNYLSAYMTMFEDNYKTNFGHYITRTEYTRGNFLHVLFILRLPSC